jgi:hypothetical protein
MYFYIISFHHDLNKLKSESIHEITHGIEELLRENGLVNKEQMDALTMSQSNIESPEYGKRYALREKEQYARIAELREKINLGDFITEDDLLKKLKTVSNITKLPNGKYIVQRDKSKIRYFLEAFTTENIVYKNQNYEIIDFKKMTDAFNQVAGLQQKSNTQIG